MQVIAETRKGLRSGLTFECKMCKFKKVVWTERPETKTMNINTSAVAGIIAVGGGFSNMEEFFGAMDIPSMSLKTFNREHTIISTAWKETAMKQMEMAIAEEKNLAIEQGNVDVHGIPCLTVIADGSWAKRSYRTNYSSLSGVVSCFLSIQI